MPVVPGEVIRPAVRTSWDTFFVPGVLEYWQRRLVTRELGEDPEDWHTWKLDDVWRDACAEMATLGGVEGRTDARSGLGAL